MQFEDDAELRTALDGIFARRPAAEWIECFIAWEVPGAEILPPGEVLEHPHFQARHRIDELDRDYPSRRSSIRWCASTRRSGRNWRFPKPGAR